MLTLKQAAIYCRLHGVEMYHVCWRPPSANDWSPGTRGFILLAASSKHASGLGGWFLSGTGKSRWALASLDKQLRSLSRVGWDPLTHSNVSTPTEDYKVLTEHNKLRPRPRRAAK